MFVQDTISLTSALSAVLGVKLEDDPFSGWAPLPDARFSWAIADHATLWAAASRAIRSPTPFDTEVIEKLGTVTYLAANTQFHPEEVRAYELGSRLQPSADVSLTVAAFYDVYDDLRTVDPAPVSVLPLYWGNSMRGDTFGVDAWANWQLTDWWRLSPGVSWVRERLAFKAGAKQLLGVSQAADDPSSHARLTSSMSLPCRMSFDATFRYVGALRVRRCPITSTSTPDSLEAPRRRPIPRGANFLHTRHIELPPPAGEQITRSVIAEARLKF